MLKLLWFFNKFCLGTLIRLEKDQFILQPVHSYYSRQDFVILLQYRFIALSLAEILP